MTDGIYGPVTRKTFLRCQDILYRRGAVWIAGVSKRHRYIDGLYYLRIKNNKITWGSKRFFVEKKLKFDSPIGLFKDYADSNI